MEAFVRTELLLGRDAIERLQQARVAVFGLGGVGGYVVEALARSGVGALDLIDHDTVSVSNLNRQIFALHSTIGRDKADVAKERVLDINPDIQVTLWKTFYLPDTADQFDLTQYDYIVDAIDTVTGKLELITRAKAAGTPILCAMGTGNKLDPTSFTVTDLSKTAGDGLARVMRKELKKRGITHLKVVYSTELPHKTLFQPEPEPGSTRRSTPGSVPFVPPTHCGQPGGQRSVSEINKEEPKMKQTMERQAAWELLRKYNQDHFHLQHALTVEGVMRWYAQELGYGEDVDFWGNVGLLHDIDFEQYPDQHCIKAPELLREGGADDALIHAVCSHGYGITVDIQPEHEMEKVLFAADELTGLIWATALMRPSKSTKDLELKSVKKKFKQHSFAAGCSREVITTGAERLGWTVEDLISKTILAMRSCEDQVNAAMAAL